LLLSQHTNQKDGRAQRDKLKHEARVKGYIDGKLVKFAEEKASSSDWQPFSDEQYALHSRRYSRNYTSERLLSNA
jgi:hypothetical protein